MFEAHFQSFEDRSERGASAPRLAALRAELKRRGLDGFIVPRADRYQNEYVPPCAERLAWLTGFTGSAGLAIVLADRAVIFIDGRYLVQVRDEVDASAFKVEHLIEHPPAQWIEENLPAGAKLGYSPWLHTVDGAERFAKACEAAKASLVAVGRQPDRHELARPAGGAARRGRAARFALCRRRGRSETRARPRRHAEDGGRCARGLRSAIGVVALQHSRQRRPAHAGGACLRHRAERRAARALCRRPQARQRCPASPRRTGRCTRQ